MATMKENTKEKKNAVKYPENLYLKDKITLSGRSIDYLAEKIGVSRELISRTINGHYKGTNIVPAINKLLKK